MDKYTGLGATGAFPGLAPYRFTSTLRVIENNVPRNSVCVTFTIVSSADSTPIPVAGLDPTRF